MDNWSGDQYTIYSESRYPLFSDMETGDYMITQYKEPKQKIVNSFEDKFTAEQQGIPAYIACRCPHCFNNNVNPMMGHKSTPKIFNQQSGQRAIVQRSPVYTQPKSDEIVIDSNCIVIVFMFLIIVFICCFFGKAISELKLQLK